LQNFSTFIFYNIINICTYVFIDIENNQNNQNVCNSILINKLMLLRHINFYFIYFMEPNRNVLLKTIIMILIILSTNETGSIDVPEIHIPLKIIWNVFIYTLKYCRWCFHLTSWPTYHIYLELNNNYIYYTKYRHNIFLKSDPTCTSTYL
jgi:hypothetical protein